MSEKISRRAEQSQRDAERMWLEDEVHDRVPRCDPGRDRAPRRDPGHGRATRRDPEPHTKSEIDLTRHRDFMHNEGPPSEMGHLEELDLDVDDRAFVLLDDRCNCTCHLSRWAYKARSGFNKVNQEL